jgi:hypothetical protein
MEKKGSAKLSTMRFMLRGRAEQQGVGGVKRAHDEAPEEAALPAAALGGGPGGQRRLVCVRDTGSTAVASLETTLKDNGGIVSGRLSYGGANKTVEAAAKAAYASQSAASEEVTDLDLARAGFAGEQCKQQAERVGDRTEGAGGGDSKRKKQRQ